MEGIWAELVFRRMPWELGRHISYHPQINFTNGVRNNCLPADLLKILDAEQMRVSSQWATLEFDIAWSASTRRCADECADQCREFGTGLKLAVTMEFTSCLVLSSCIPFFKKIDTVRIHDISVIDCICHRLALQQTTRAIILAMIIRIEWMLGRMHQISILFG